MTETMEVMVDLGEESYPVIIGSGILKSLGSEMKKLKLKGKVLVLTNPQVDRYYGAVVKESLENKGYEVRTMPLNPGEEFKSLETVKKVYDTLISCKYERSSTIVALGGGVIGDMAGFIAGTYMRGINLVHVPTTLLAQVDSSVGGKTGVNHNLGKNMIGVFYQPKLVLTDVSTLKTLPEREMISGMAEVIKYGLIKDAKFHKLLQKELKDGVYDSAKKILLNDELLVNIVTRCCEIKSFIVEEDEKEQGIRVILNFGHTVGHALETFTEYRKYTHGEAVSLGIVAATYLSFKKGFISEEDFEGIVKLLENARLPTRSDVLLERRKMIELIRHDKKVTKGAIRFVLLKKLGRAVVEEVENISEIEGSFMKLCEEVVA